MAALVRQPQAAALPQDGGGCRRAAPRRRTAGRGGDGTDRIAGRAARAAQPHSRRLLGRERALVRRPGLAHRSGRPRRPPRDRPGHAGLVRRASPGPHPGRLQRHGAAGGGLAGQDPAAPAASAAGARVPVRLLVPGRGGFRGPFGPVGLDPSRLPGVPVPACVNPYNWSPFGHRTAELVASNAYGWLCTSPAAAVDTTAACDLLYHVTDAVSRFAVFSSPYFWQCWN